MPADYSRFQRPQISSPADLVPTAVTAEKRYEEDAPEVTRVLVRVERGDGTAREYLAVEPQNCEVTTGMATGSTHAIPTLNLHLIAHPRHNLHISTHGPWRLMSQEAHDALADFLHAMGYQ